MNAVHLWITGRVQGVSFRGATRERAEQLGITGWVRNLRDGRVEAWFEGTSEAVVEMVRWCRSGPSRAEVESVEVEEATVSRLETFEIVADDVMRA